MAAYLLLKKLNQMCRQVDQGTKEDMPPKFLANLGISCFERQCPKYCCSLEVKVFAPRKKFGLAALLLVTTFIQMACIFLARSHVLKYQAFHTACTFLLGVQSSTDQ